MKHEQEKETVLKMLLILIWFLALVHMAAEYYYLYWTLRWFDIVTHFLGGIWLGMAGIWIWFYSGYLPIKEYSQKSAVFVALFTGVTIGFIWELYELIVWKLSGEGLPLNYTGDTILDLIIDTIGALMAFVILRLCLFDRRKKRLGHA